MALKAGRCKNYGGCSYADDRQIVEADEASFVCPGCGSVLTPWEDGGKLPWSGQSRRIFLLVGGAVLAAFAGAGVWWATISHTGQARGYSLDSWVDGDPPAPELKSVRKRIAARAPRVAVLKSGGKVIGSEHGLLNPVASATLGTDDLSLLDRENTDRRKLYGYVVDHTDPPVSYERVANAFAMRRWREWPTR